MTARPPAGSRRSALRAGGILFALLCIGGGASWWWSQPEAPAPTGVVTIVPASLPTATAAAPSTPSLPPPPLTPDRTIVRDVSNGRVDPPLDTLIATAPEDVRTLHDQIAQQTPEARDAERERLLTRTFATGGVRIERVICAGILCEIAGTTTVPAAISGERVADTLAQANLEVGPSTVGPSRSRDGHLFVVYVTSTAEG